MYSRKKKNNFRMKVWEIRRVSKQKKMWVNQINTDSIHSKNNTQFMKLKMYRAKKNCTTVMQDVTTGASLVAQWLRICLPMQGTRVRALVQEDPTCCGATKPMCHNFWACALEPTSHNYWAHVPQLLKATRLEPVLCNKRSHRDEKPVHCNKE